MKIIWFIFPPARHQASCLISSFDSVNDLNGLNGWNDLNKVEIELRAAHSRFDGATNPVDRKPSRAKHATGLIFQLRKAKEKNSVALDKFRESGTTVTPTIDHSLLDEVLAGK
jgi:hypothetical protein